MHSKMKAVAKRLARPVRSFIGTNGVAAQISELRERVEQLHADRDQPQVAPEQGSPPPPTIGELEIYQGYSQADANLLRKYESRDTKPGKGFVVDFIGTRTNVAYMHGISILDGQRDGVPIPANWHAEAAEWAGMLKSVEQANGRLAVMELGAGWGPCVVACALAARRRGIEDIRLCAVEGDPGHFDYMIEHFRNNGIDPAKHDLIKAAVGVTDGTARWPKVSDPAGDWGSRPFLAAEGEGDTDHVGRVFQEWLDVQVVSFSSLLEKQPVWDLVHIDVQGHEVELCAAVPGLLDDRVKWLVVGTHDYKLHGDLMDMMFRKGWSLENEKPPRIHWHQGVPSLLSLTTHDGVQVWRNPALAG